MAHRFTLPCLSTARRRKRAFTEVKGQLRHGQKGCGCGWVGEKTGETQVRAYITEAEPLFLCAHTSLMAVFGGSNLICPPSQFHSPQPPTPPSIYTYPSLLQSTYLLVARTTVQWRGRGSLTCLSALCA